MNHWNNEQINKPGQNTRRSDIEQQEKKKKKKENQS